MLKRTWSLLLVLALFAAPAAFAAAPDRDTVGRSNSLLERIWGQLVRLLDLDGDAGAGERTPGADQPRRISAGDDLGGQVDPDG